MLWVWPKPRASVLLGLYRPIADMQGKLHVPWGRPEPKGAVQLGPDRPNTNEPERDLNE